MVAITHVLTPAHVAELLGEDEDLLHEISIEMEPEDGMIRLHSIADDYTRAFTRFGIENPRYLIELHNAGGRCTSQASSPQSDA